MRVRGTRQSSQRLRQRRAWVADRYSPPARRLHRAGCSFRWSRDFRGRVESSGARREGRAGNSRRDVERGGPALATQPARRGDRGAFVCREPGCLCALRRASQGPRSRNPVDLPFSLNDNKKCKLVSPGRLPLVSLKKVPGESTLGARRAALPPKDPLTRPSGSDGGGSLAPGERGPGRPRVASSPSRLPACLTRPRKVVGTARPEAGRRFDGEEQELSVETGFLPRNA